MWPLKPLLSACVFSAAVTCSSSSPAAGKFPIEAGFADPPKSCMIQTWWHWINDCVTKEGIVRDLKAMSDAGISAAHIYCPRISSVKPTTKIMSPGWLELFAFAIAEAEKRGIELGFHNCPGWSSSGGPWIVPENSMKCLVASALDVCLDAPVTAASVKLPKPPVLRNYYGDVRLFAFPVELPPRRVSADPPRAVPLRKNDVFEIPLEYAEAFSPSVMVIETPRPSFYMKVEIFAEEDGVWKKRASENLRMFRVSDVPRAYPVAPGKPAKKWKAVFGVIPAPSYIPRSDVPLRSLELGNWPYKGSGLSADPVKIVDLGNVVKNDAVEASLLKEKLDPRVSTGWRILRVGYTTTGRAPGPATVGGLECDKLVRKGIDVHWKAMPERILALPGAKKTVKYVAIDSFEQGLQTWTETLPEEFRVRTGNPIWRTLPVILGYEVGSKKESSRLKKEFDGVIADLFAENYFDRFSELCREAGVKSVTEPYGGPFDTVRCAREADVLTCEFWLGKPLHRSVPRVVKAARAHGKNIIAAEAFTTEDKEGRWLASPRILKAAGDEAWAAGVNLIVYHSYVHQAYVDRVPGFSLGRHGTQLNVNTTWWPMMRAWTDYVKRGQFLLQFGRIAKDRHDVVPGKIEAIVRQGGAGEKIWFVRNRSKKRVREILALDCAGGVPPREFDAATGKIFSVPVVKGGVEVDLEPGGSRFIVFAKGSAAPPRDVPGKILADMSSGWTITSFSGPGAPDAPLRCGTLFDWRDSSDDRMKHFAGTAVYEREGAFPAGILDLGEVREVAEVFVDGKKTATLAFPPYRTLVPAGKKLSVRVANTWPNRLIGDALRRSRGEKPYTWVNWEKGWLGNEELLPSGLTGPVSVRERLTER